MADNLMAGNLNPNYLYLSKDTSGVLDYPKFFDLFLNSKNNPLFDTHEEMLSNLEKAKENCLKLEKSFYKVFGAESYEDFRRVMEQRLSLIQGDFLTDYIKLTNSGLRLTEGKDGQLLYTILQKQRNNKSSQKAYLSKEVLDEIQQAFVEIFSLTNGNHFTPFGQEIYTRFFHNLKVGYKIKDPAVNAKIELDFLNICSNSTFKNDYENTLKEIFDERIRFKDGLKISVYDMRDGIIFSLSQKLSRYFKTLGFKIEFINRKGENQEIVLDYKSSEIQREIYYDGRVPLKMARQTFEKKIQDIIAKNKNNENILDLQKSHEDFLNPVLTRNDFTSGWMGKLSETQAEQLTKNIITWTQENFSLSPNTSELLFLAANSTDGRRDIIRAFTTDSGIIGYFGEIMGELLFNKLFGGAQGELVVSGIGGKIGAARRKESSFEKLEQWRKGTQPPVDLLLKYTNDAGLTNKLGIQVKHSYSADAKTSHAVDFIGEKSIYDIFEQDLNIIPNEIKDQLVPLLQGYYGNRAIQKYFSQESTVQEEEKQNRGKVTIRDGIEILDATSIINKILSFFMDIIMDFGEYKGESTQNGEVLELYRERNIFLLYLNEYFVPASAIIDWALQTIKNNGRTLVISTASGTSTKKVPEMMKNLSFNSPYNLLDRKNIKEIRMSVSVKFLKDNLAGYNFLSNFM